MRSRNRSRAGMLVVLAVVGATLLAPTGASASYQSTSDAAISLLAVCRDGIQFLFAADFYSADTASSGDGPPFRAQSMQAAAPVPPTNADGRVLPPLDTLVLDVTVHVPYWPQRIDFDNLYHPPVFPEYPPRTTLSGPYPQPTGVQVAKYTSAYTLTWAKKLKPGPRAVVLSCARFDPVSESVEIIADVDNCYLFRRPHRGHKQTRP
jgi:hypothetical protein